MSKIKWNSEYYCAERIYSVNGFVGKYHMFKIDVDIASNLSVDVYINTPFGFREFAVYSSVSAAKRGLERYLRKIQN